MGEYFEGAKGDIGDVMEFPPGCQSSGYGYCFETGMVLWLCLDMVNL